MNAKDLPNDWKAFASQMWPEYPALEIQIKFKEEMKSVIYALATQREETAKLLDLLERIGRKDILARLEEYSQYLFSKPFIADTFLRSLPQPVSQSLPKPALSRVIVSKDENLDIIKVTLLDCFLSTYWLSSQRRKN